MFDSLGSGSIFIVPHDYDEKIYGDHALPGRFNVGVMAFRRDERGLKCLEWWRDRCIEWCRFEAEDGKWGDQGYLEDWPERFQGVVISDHSGIHAGPWNIGKYGITSDIGKHTLLNSKPLVCYHFHSMSMINDRTALIHGGHTFMSPMIRDSIYRPYVCAVRRALRELSIAGHRVHMKIDLSTALFLTKRFLRGTLKANIIRE